MIEIAMRRFSLVLLALPLMASTAVGQERSKSAPAAERPATAAPRTAPASGQRAPAATPAGEARRTGETGARSQAGAPAGGGRPNRPGGAQAALVESFDDWSAYATPAGRGRICYALSQPTARAPRTLSRDDAYLFVSIRPAENVRNEVAVMLGFPVLESGAAEAARADASGRGAAAKPAPEQQLVVGGTRFAIAGKDQNAWLADAAQEGSLVAVMSRGQKLVVRAVSKRGAASTDEYSLKGFGDALRKAREECR